MENLADLEPEYEGKLTGLAYTPVKFQTGNVKSHLDVDHLVEANERNREKADRFVCQICQYIVVDPKECSSCESVFCSDCIGQCVRNCCPKKCQGNDKAKWKQINRHLKNDLNELVFKCQDENCAKELAYRQALDHLNKCDHTLVACPQLCGLGILNKDLKFHFENQCSLTRENCKRCEGLIFKNRDNGPHDCVNTLKRQLHAQK